MSMGLSRGREMIDNHACVFCTGVLSWYQDFFRSNFFYARSVYKYEVAYHRDRERWYCLVDEIGSDTFGYVDFLGFFDSRDLAVNSAETHACAKLEELGG